MRVVRGQVRKLEATRSRLEEELKIARAAVEEARKVQQECDRRRIDNERLQVHTNAPLRLFINFDTLQ